jgi:hypothetical protein
MGHDGRVSVNGLIQSSAGVQSRTYMTTSATQELIQVEVPLDLQLLGFKRP